MADVFLYDIRSKIMEMRDEAHDAQQKSTQTNEIIYHRAETETLEKVLKIIEQEVPW